MNNPPQIFHDKEDNPPNFILIPSDLFAAINHLCNGNESKILLTLLGCKGDGSFSPSAQYVQKMTGISQPNNYYKIRKKLEAKGYIETDAKGNLYIDSNKILKQYQNDTTIKYQNDTYNK